MSWRQVGAGVCLALSACSGDAPDAPEVGAEDACVTDREFFAAEVVPVLHACVACHVAGGVADGTRHVLVPFDQDDAIDRAFTVWRDLVRNTDDGARALLDKPTGDVPHGGGRMFGRSDARYSAIAEMVARLQSPGGCAAPDGLATCEPGGVHPGPAPLRRLTDAQVRNAVAELFGVDLPAGLFPPTDRNDQFRTFAANNGVSDAGIQSILEAAEYVARNVDLDESSGCAGDAPCLRSWLEGLVTRAWRRPATPAELALFADVFDAEADPIDGARLAIEVLLQTPQFLYLDVSTTGADPTVRPLDDHAIASRLAFFLTDSPPDAELSAAAAAGQLHTPEQIRPHALRLLEDPRILAVVSRFHEDWLHLARLDGAARDPTLYPDFSEALVGDMLTEASLFAADVLWLGDGTFDALFQARDAWVTSSLADLYGVDDPGPGWHRVRVDRPGVLTRTGFLSAHAHTATTSPVRRGAFVLEQLLCEDLTPPTDISTELPPATDDAVTVRDRLEQHWTDERCAACHTRIDPVGFAFEHYGALGEARDTWEDGTPIDASGSLDDPAGSFHDAAELVEILRTSDRARTCYARRWLEYGLGRPSTDTDVCTVDDIGARFVDGGGNIRTLLVDIAVSDAFLYALEAP